MRLEAIRRKVIQPRLLCSTITHFSGAIPLKQLEGNPLKNLGPVVPCIQVHCRDSNKHAMWNMEVCNAWLSGRGLLHVLWNNLPKGGLHALPVTTVRSPTRLPRPNLATSTLPPGAESSGRRIRTLPYRIKYSLSPLSPYLIKASPSCHVRTTVPQSLSYAFVYDITLCYIQWIRSCIYQSCFRKRCSDSICV